MIYSGQTVFYDRYAQEDLSVLVQKDLSLLVANTVVAVWQAHDDRQIAHVLDFPANQRIDHYNCYESDG